MTTSLEFAQLRHSINVALSAVDPVRSYQTVTDAEATAGYEILRESPEILVHLPETLTGTPTISLPSSPSVQDRVEILRSGGVDLTETVTSSVLSADSLTRFEWNGTVWIGAVLGGSSAGGTDDQTAAEVPFTPAGDIAATNVQAAIEELDAEKLGVGAQAADADTVDGQHAAAFATAAQGATADTALQPADIASGTITARADDIDFSGGSDGNVLTVQADGSLAIEALPAAGAFALPDATDVTITAVGTGELLAYTGAEWENQTLAEAGVATAAQGALADTALQDVADDTSPQLGGDLDGQGNAIAGFKNGVVSVDTTSGDVTLTMAAHGGALIRASGGATNQVIVPNTAGFSCVIKAESAIQVEFNATTAAAMASGDLMTILVPVAGTIDAVLTAAADKVTFS